MGHYFSCNLSPLNTHWQKIVTVIRVIYLQVISLIFFENLELMVYKNMPVDLLVFFFILFLLKPRLSFHGYLIMLNKIHLDIGGHPEIIIPSPSNLLFLKTNKK